MWSAILTACPARQGPPALVDAKPGDHAARTHTTPEPTTYHLARVDDKGPECSQDCGDVPVPPSSMA